MSIAVPVAGSAISSSGFGAPVANLLNALGFAASNFDTVSNVGTTTTEVVSSGCFLNAVAGYRYGVFYTGVSESSVQFDIATLQLKYQYSGSFGTGGTSIATTNKTAITASKGDGVTLIGQFLAPSTGLVAVSATIKRIVGTGTVKQNGASAGQSLSWLIIALGTN
jgi:hypothetical protein